MATGSVLEVWRYPVKSMGGERLQSATIGARGISGDRGWALRDEAAQEIRGAKKLPALLRCSARYLEEPGTDRIPAAEMTLPDGARVRTDAPEAAERLSALLGRRVTLWPLQPADHLDHYRRGMPDDPDMMKELRSIFGRLEDEPLPDLSAIPQELFTLTSIPGTYFDVLPLHLLTTATLSELGRLNAASSFSPRRFRPNVLIELDERKSGFAELDWCGRTVAVGGARVKVHYPTVRCVMTTLPQEDLPKDPRVLRTIVRDANQAVGVYADVVTPGTVAVGDRIDVGD
jgi:uncharacterized protein YcbX